MVFRGSSGLMILPIGQMPFLGYNTGMIKKIACLLTLILFPAFVFADDSRINLLISAQTLPDFAEVSAEIAYPAFAFGLRVSGMGYGYESGAVDSVFEGGLYATAYPFAPYSGLNVSTGYCMAFKNDNSGYFNQLFNGWFYPWFFNNYFYTTVGWKLNINPEGSVFVFIDFGTKFQIKYMQQNSAIYPFGRLGFGTKIL
jgi:hypothetical protein